MPDRGTIHTLDCDDAKAFVCDAVWGFALVQPDGKFYWINKAYADILNAPIEIVIDTTSADWTHPDDLEIDEELAAKVRTGELDGYTLSKRYIQRGSTPRNPREIWGLLSVAGLWTKEKQFRMYQVQFRPYNNLAQNERNRKWSAAYTWLKTEYKTAIAIVVAIATTIFAAYEKLSNVQNKTSEAVQQVESSGN